MKEQNYYFNTGNRIIMMNLNNYFSPNQFRLVYDVDRDRTTMNLQLVGRTCPTVDRKVFGWIINTFSSSQSNSTELLISTF